MEGTQDTRVKGINVFVKIEEYYVHGPNLDLNIFIFYFYSSLFNSSTSKPLFRQYFPHT